METTTLLTLASNPIKTLLVSFTLIQFLVVISLILATLYLSSRRTQIYLVDFTCYQPPDHCRVPIATFLEHTNLCGEFTDAESIEFQEKVLERSGVGSETCLPAVTHEVPVDASLNSAKSEIETVLFAAVKELFVKHDINPTSIDILVANCSLFCPTPSITAMIVNKFGFRANVRSYNLSGMGCSCGLLSISLARDLLRVHKNALALVLSMEAISPNGYHGNDKSMLLSNCLFRMGGAAILLSNRKRDKTSAKYVLRHLVRTHRGSDDRSYRCVFQEPDEEGKIGVALSRSILNVAGDALKANLVSLGPLVLPYSEQFRYVWSVILRKFWPPAKKYAVYVPDFKKAFEHFCIHAGGKAVIDAIEGSLSLCQEDVEASKMTLYRFGNTSSSSIWYELCYLEAKERVKKGDRIWQIALGSGFKCNSAVWECVSDLEHQVKNAWSDRIHLYPMEVPDVLDH